MSQESHPTQTDTNSRLSTIAILATLTLGNFACADARPNVILCMADDLGWGDTGYNGSKIVQTPNLDAMAKNGIRFDRWYAGAPVCSPTRGNCLTGRHPIRLGIPSANQGHIRPSESTLAERLKALGYSTGHFGKWHVGTLTTSMRDSNRGNVGNTKDFSPPWRNGFDVCFSTEAKVPTYDPMRRPDSKNVRYGWTPVDKEGSKQYGTHYFNELGQVVTDNLAGDDSRVIMDRVVPFIQTAASKQQPFFAIVWFHAPHLPVVAGPKHSQLYAQLDWKQQMYYGCITALDEQMGRLQQELEKLDIAENTMVWFSSDNGPESKTPGATNGLRARKRSLYEGGIRVPGLMTWPLRVPQPRVVTAPCHSGDYFPTVLAAVQEKTDTRDLDGQNILPLIDGTRDSLDRVIHFRYREQAAVIGDRFKLYRRKKNVDWELYDLQHDRSEKHNLAARRADVVMQLQASYDKWNAGLAP